MRVRADITVAVLVILLCAWAVASQLGFDPLSGSPEAIRPLELGERLAGNIVLGDAGEPPRPTPVSSLFGRRATVLYTWSVPCPCIDVLEPRLAKVHARYNRRDQGVAWVALAGEPEDTPPMVRRKMEAIGAFYPLLLDSEQQVCRRLGFRHAAQVAVLDGEGRLVYRGAVDDRYDGGEAEFLEEALAAVVAGRPVPVAERAWAYGCEFNVPESCLEYERP